VSKSLNIRVIAIAGIWLFVSNMLFSQNLVGMKESDVVKYMSGNMQKYSMEKDIVNDTHKYLRYSTGDGMQTLLLFFDDKGYCKEVRLNLDRSLYNSKIRELDSSYSKQSSSEWTETKGKRLYSITMTDDTWYYTLKFKEIKK
jgi:hypothetical protein